MELPVTFSSFDGTHLVGIVTIPAEKATAIVLMMHGIPSDMDEWGFYKDMAAYLADHGIGSLRFDFRSCGKSAPGSLSDLTLSQMINDIDAAYWELIRHFGDAVPTFAVGTSCGGGVTLRWSNVFGRNLDGVFLMAPVLDYEFEVTGTRRAISDKCHVALSDSDQSDLITNGTLNKDIGYGKAMINEAHIFSAAQELGTASQPITIFQGDSDTVVPIDITRTATNGISQVELVLIPGADHGFAVDGDDDLTAPGTKANHRTVYEQLARRIRDDHPGR